MWFFGTLTAAALGRTQNLSQQWEVPYLVRAGMSPMGHPCTQLHWPILCGNLFCPPERSVSSRLWGEVEVLYQKTLHHSPQREVRDGMQIFQISPASLYSSTTPGSHSSVHSTPQDIPETSWNSWLWYINRSGMASSTVTLFKEHSSQSQNHVASQWKMRYYLRALWGAFPCYLLRGNVLGLVLFLWWISDSHRGKISFFGSWFLGFQSMVSWFSYCEHQKRVNSLVPVDNHTEMGKKGQGKRGGKMGEKKKKVRARYPLKYTHTHTPIPISSNQTPSYTGLPFFSNTLFEIQVHQWLNHWWKQRPHDPITSPKLTFIHCSYGNSRTECISMLEDTA